MYYTPTDEEIATYINELHGLTDRELIQEASRMNASGPTTKGWEEVAWKMLVHSELRRSWHNDVRDKVARVLEGEKNVID